MSEQTKTQEQKIHQSHEELTENHATQEPLPNLEEAKKRMREKDQRRRHPEGGKGL